MKKKRVFIVLGVVVVALICCAVVLGGSIFVYTRFINNPANNLKTTTTVNGQETTTYSAKSYLEETNKIISDYYNVLGVANFYTNNETDTLDVISNARIYISDLKDLMASIDVVRGEGVADYIGELNTWITENEAALKSIEDGAKVIGVDGTVETQEEADSANALIDSGRDALQIASDNFNPYFQRFANLNGISLY